MNSLINKSVSVGEIVKFGSIEYTVEIIQMLTQETHPNMWKNNIGGHVYLKCGKRGKNIYAMALNTSGNIKNGLIYDTGVKF